MGKTTIWIALITFLIAGSAPAEDYGWSLSGSSTDPNVNTGPAVASTPFFVYLWLVCSPIDGISATEFSMSTGFFDAGFTPLNGVLNAGNSVDLLLAVGGLLFINFQGARDTIRLVEQRARINLELLESQVRSRLAPVEAFGLGLAQLIADGDIDIDDSEAAAETAATGRTTVTVVPSSTLLRTRMSPLRAVTALYAP